MMFLIVMLMLPLQICANTFVISEVFSNKAGRGSDRGKEWLELTSLVDHAVAVSHLRLEIFHDQKKIVASERSFLHPLPFHNVMLIAQEKNLGLPYCLQDITVAVLTDWTLPNTGELKICAQINHREQVCTILDKKQKRPDGIALFREITDESAHPLFVPEPCHLIDGIFATPGVSARACATGDDMAKQIFKSCRRAGEPDDVLTGQFFMNSDDKPPIPFTITPHDDGISLHILEEDPKSTYLVTMCRTPKDFENFCWIDTEIDSLPGPPSRLTWSTPIGPDEKRYLMLQELHGGTTVAPLPDLPKLKFKPQPLIAIHADWQPTTVSITVNSAEQDLPMNLWITTNDGEVLHKTALLNPAPIKIDLPRDHAHMPTHVRYAGVCRNGQINLNPPPE